MQKVVLGDRKPFKGRPGSRAEKVDLEVTLKEISEKYKRKLNDDDLYAHLMYPAVFADLAALAPNRKRELLGWRKRRGQRQPGHGDSGTKTGHRSQKPPPRKHRSVVTCHHFSLSRHCRRTRVP